MGQVVPAILQLVKFVVIGIVFILHGSTGYHISPSPAIFSETAPTEGTLTPFEKPLTSNVLGSVSQPNGLHLHPPLALPPPMSTPLPQEFKGLVPSHSPSSPVARLLHNTAPPPLNFEGHAPPLSLSIPTVSPPYSAAPPPLIVEHELPMPPNASQRKALGRQTPVPVPVAAPSNNLSYDSPMLPPIAPETSPIINPSPPEISPPSAHHNKNMSVTGTPITKSIAPVASPPRELRQNQPSSHLIAPTKMPFVSPVPVVSPTRELPRHSPSVLPGEPPAILPVPDVSHASSPPTSIDRKKDRSPIAAPPDETPSHLPSADHSPTKGSFSAVAPSTHEPTGYTSYGLVPSSSPPNHSLSKGNHTSASSPSIPFHKQNHSRTDFSSPAPAYSPPSKQQGPVASPSFLPTSRRTHYAPPPISPGSSASPSHFHFPKPVINVSPAPSPSPTAASGWTKMPILSPEVSPSGSSPRSPKMPPRPPVHALPPPPPNEDCSSTVCVEPYTNTPPGSPCGCVLPMQVGLRLSVALYTFFPLVSELAQEIATGVFMKQSQVRIMGANAASQQPEKTVVLIDLVPLGERFDNTTAVLTFHRFWHKQVVIKASFFGDYEVLYVRYPGLPPSPPSPSGITIIDDGPYSGNNNNARTIKPLGVDVHKRHRKDGLGAGMIAIISLSASLALILCSAVAWVLLVRHRGRMSQPTPTPQPLPPSGAKPSGTTGSVIGSGLSSASLSFGSSIAPYTGSAKTFSISDIERATNNFNASRILGEGGFGRVYSGVLEDGTKVAVKVLKRDDHQGGREFLAEVEMLSRLHHRNLVKLIGICTEERARCLVYELIPNGSVESHLHGADKESAPLDWDARIRIALGAARGLAYLHEDSSPHVIHRDFKSSNILLEHDFTPKVSDFGLARTAMDEDNRHISTRVMGTFGYVAPEYAMTGHLLVKSDVYSYGVVVLELLTGRKPVDMLQPPGQENLVAWARPLLTSKEGLEIITDPSLGPDVPFDSVAKVAAIASMCVQPEVSNRPFMGEVVQALKLVCNECDEAKEVGSRSPSWDISVDMDAEASAGSGHMRDPFQNRTIVPNYDSEPDIERGLSMSDLFSTSVRYGRQASGSFRRYSSSGPLRTGRGKQLWQRMRRLTGESVSEHGGIFRIWPGSH
ncbi:receptor-like serine/threonine-protein kinase ALE2 isoform X1 [Ricinus communis]|uniref:receptor-like serine/threonine-protein kinase ALE2 isoform X1 n=1 Tax=Ricinus communis TaxID=3988 RepID=UPI00077220F2|nr:receptor-like serine/threonine-protein kinase ALE2 isoform X1 [Ricinus communis]XP_048228414.1 receptor-like serine/threonine-protein kinase ALE2 isoform X1 [Ricinus communis]XP_048228415.1 receptor-like serine/threonine-protein kinase ALE2 isoform X1 [Ricinus communis]|eukprot:XP_015571719.1 receptor-like serine/threonine-protein kinase ALE2 isoform X1 [Ricinus communis]